ncbi:TadA family conjugal transfer-associated ATPase [Demequina sp. NBRC 110054]|uniref:TadA family conjugal transfer-associated ATPase n=1 Tax=Demequina sp. NBRC 110054 TaxID=1570343 RepID=UPI0035D51E40
MPAVPDASSMDDAPGWAGALGPLLALPGVTDVLVNGPADVWVDRGEGLERADLGVRAALATPGAVRDLAVRLASLAGRRLDDAAPCVDARLPDGSRLHAVLPPVADGCAALSLRRLRAAALDPRELVASGMVTASGMAGLLGLVKGRASLLLTGATGSGKTTLLTALLSLASPTERIVVIEEAGEVAPDHPHVVRLVERRANVEGAGAVPLSALVREALRMRPDRVVLGECRGAELREVLLAFNTGHRGGLVTMHANSAGDVPARLTALGALAGMGAEAVALHAAAAFDAVIHLARGPDGVRRVVQTARLVLDDGRLAVVPLEPSALAVTSVGSTPLPVRASSFEAGER